MKKIFFIPAFLLISLVFVFGILAEDTLLFSGNLYFGDQILIGPYTLLLLEKPFPTLLVLKDDEILNDGEKLLVGEEFEIENLNIFIEDVFEWGIKLNVWGPSNYLAGRSDIFFTIENVETYPKELEPGASFDLKINLVNEGVRRAYNVSITLEIPHAIPQLFSTEESGTERYFDYIDAREPFSVMYSISSDLNTPSGEYFFRININYFDGVSKKPRTATKIFGLTISGLPDIEIAKFSSIPKKIRPGAMNVQLIMSVENQGTDDARFLSVKLLPREPFEFSSSYEQSYNLGILKRGMYSDAIFFIDVDKKARSGNYSIPVQVSFMDSKNKIHKIEKTITVTIKESPYLEVVGFETSPKEVAASKYVDLKIIIKNTGDEKAEEVVVEAQEVSEYPFDFEVLSDFLGNLSPGKTGQATLRLKVDRNANLKEYILVIQLKCTGDREREDFGVYYFEDTVTLKVEREGSQAKVYLAIAVILVILGALILHKVIKS